jgi:hypothetical protein
MSALGEEKRLSFIRDAWVDIVEKKGICIINCTIGFGNY